MRRRLLCSLDDPKPAVPDPRTEDPFVEATDPPAPSTPPAAAGGSSGAVFGSANADVRRDVEDQQAGPPRTVYRAVVPRDVLLPAEVRPRSTPGVDRGALLAALLPRAKPKPVPSGTSNGHGHTRPDSSCREVSSDRMLDIRLFARWSRDFCLWECLSVRDAC